MGTRGMTNAYDDFIASKLSVVPPTGIPEATAASEHLFPHQQLLTQWALRRGRAAVFANLGLGKSRIGLTWAHHVNQYTRKPVIILTPLAVGQQMAEESTRIGVDARLVRDASQVGPAINICNYERLHKLDPDVFGGVVCDESGAIKGIGSKTLAQLKEAFDATPFMLAATATPSPNDFAELTQHAELLGIAKRMEVLGEFFHRDASSTKDWTIKPHARKLWWRFVASWGALVRSPADLGFDASAYALPPINRQYHVIEATRETVADAGLLFAAHANTLMERRAARKASIGQRVQACVDLVNADNERWICWSDLNDESRSLAKGIRGAVEVTGSMDIDEKERALGRFLSGEARVLVSKPSLCGHGVNMQFCNHVAFVGISDSWEAQYQAIGRCHRFGQTKTVNVHFFMSEMERNVLDNLKRKESDAQVMGEELSRETAELVRGEVLGTVPMVDAYLPAVKMSAPGWLRSES